jgi:hypothetical protein
MMAKKLISMLVILAITAAVFMTWEQSAEAIPAFARKYETSCVTCHVGYPKLNAFGEAFRLNGFQYPEDDEDQTKDEPVSMGSDAYKKVFPNAVWPNNIPGKPPLALRVQSGWQYQKDGDPETAFIAPSLNLLSGGTLGENTSWLAGAHLFEQGEVGSIDRAFLQLSRILGTDSSPNLLSLRVGQFIPNITSFANHRGWALTPYAYNTFAPGSDEFGGDHEHGGDAFGLESFQLGAEIYGIVVHRLRWHAGLVNGSGVGEETNSAKDGYFSALYKLGGMGFDGHGATADASGRNWVDNSITLGGFAYVGTQNNDSTSGPNDLMRERFGVDVNVWFKNSNLFGGWITGFDETIQGTSLTRDEYNLYFAELDQVIYPWLFALARYERAEPEGATEIQRVVAGVTTMYRANIKLVLETYWNPDDTQFENLFINLDYAF